MNPRPNQQPQNLNQTKHTPAIAILGLVLSILIAPIGLIVSIVAWRKIRRQSLKGKGLAVAGTVLGVLITVPMLWLFIALGGFLQLIHGNQAEKDFRPIANQMIRLGGQKICDNGDSGYGIDNSAPWYQIYYTVPDTPDLTRKVESFIGQQGYQVSTDTNFINQLKGLPDQDGTYTEPYGGEQFNSRSNYLTGQSGNKSLKITINRQTSVPLYCGVSNYGKQRQTGDKAIIDFSLSLPDRYQ